MTVQGVERKFAAILSADVVGFSRLMGDDEEGTLAVLKSHRAELLEPKIADHNGRLVKTMGDGLLIEFASVVDAVRYALEVQHAMSERNTDVAEDGRIEFRMGINLGDVIVEGDDLYGDGVNVAARLESLAQPGGICVSRSARDQVRDKFPLTFEDLGEQNVKNIARPIRVFRIAVEANAPSAAGKGAAPAAASLPSIAVLPFDPMSNDPEQEYFADGVIEDIITELSRFPGLFVIARNSTFVYKGRATKVQDVANDLGVRYVVEGSVRRAGDRVRISAQLIDAATGNHVWAERYDRDIEDIFALQDEIAQTIAATLPGRVEAADLEHAKRKPPENLAAYDYVMRAKIHHHHGTREDNAFAQEMIQKAVELDPQYAHAWAWRACIQGQTFMRGWASREEVWERIVSWLQMAQSLDDNDSECHRILAAVYLQDKQHDKTWHHQEKALSLTPAYDLVVVQQGELLTWMGQPEEGAEWVGKAMRLNPYHPERFWGHLGRAHYGAERYADAYDAFKHITTMDETACAYMVACQAHMAKGEGAGDGAGTKAEVKQLLELSPDFAVGGFVERMPYSRETDRVRLREGLLSAGLPA